MHKIHVIGYAVRPVEEALKPLRPAYAARDYDKRQKYGQPEDHNAVFKKKLEHVICQRRYLPQHAVIIIELVPVCQCRQPYAHDGGYRPQEAKLLLVLYIRDEIAYHVAAQPVRHEVRLIGFQQHLHRGDEQYHTSKGAVFRPEVFFQIVQRRCHHIAQQTVTDVPEVVHALPAAAAQQHFVYVASRQVLRRDEVVHRENQQEYAQIVVQQYLHEVFQHEAHPRARLREFLVRVEVAAHKQEKLHAGGEQIRRYLVPRLLEHVAGRQRQHRQKAHQAE